MDERVLIEKIEKIQKEMEEFKIFVSEGTSFNRREEVRVLIEVIEKAIEQYEVNQRSIKAALEEQIED